MTDEALMLGLPEDGDLTGLDGIVGRSLHVVHAPPERLTLAYLDTFDWRLFNAGLVLEHLRGGGVGRLRLRALGSGTPRLEQRVETVPRFHQDLGPGELRRVLERSIEMRALLVQARVRMRRTVASLLDGDEKTVLRVELWEGAARRTGRWLQIVPVKGYDGTLERTRSRLRRRLDCPPLGADPLVTLTASLERPPDDYGARHSVTLDPAERTDVACKRILTELAAVIEENRQGVVEDVDSEFLHDYRVAMRRTRSLVGQVKGVFPDSRLARFREGLRWLSDLTGPARDADVYLLGFADLQRAVPHRHREALEPLRAEIELVKAESYAALAAAIGSARYRRLMQGWESFLAAPVAARPTSPNAARPVLDVARERTWRLFRRALAEGRAIGAGTPAEALHELRKTCKKLRYLIEFFRSLFPAADVAAAVRILKRLQDVLGDFQDFEVQQVELGALRERMAAHTEVTPATAAALDALLADLARRQEESRDAFAKRFAAFDTKSHRRLYRQLYRPPRGARTAR